jgi:hypothetical protein
VWILEIINNGIELSRLSFLAQKRKIVMRMLRCSILIIIFLSLPLPTLATTVAVVEAAVERAAFQRYGGQQPIKVGTLLRSGDIITTGGDARVRIRDGSLVRIGAYARFEFDRLIPPKKRGRLTGVFNVLKGIFRFTSSKSRKPNVEIQVGNVIAVGIRGTDVFTSAKANKDIVCLIESKISVQAGNVTAMLTQPREGFVVPKGKPPLPVRLIPEEKFQKWLRNSELQNRE